MKCCTRRSASPSSYLPKKRASVFSRETVRSIEATSLRLLSRYGATRSPFTREVFAVLFQLCATTHRLWRIRSHPASWAIAVTLAPSSSGSASNDDLAIDIRTGDNLNGFFHIAQEAYAETGAFPELLSIYNLFGDPIMTLR